MKIFEHLQTEKQQQKVKECHTLRVWSKPSQSYVQANTLSKVSGKHREREKTEVSEKSSCFLELES